MPAWVAQRPLVAGLLGDLGKLAIPRPMPYILNVSQLKPMLTWMACDSLDGKENRMWESNVASASGPVTTTLPQDP
jgi:hypothetical protein